MKCLPKPLQDSSFLVRCPDKLKNGFQGQQEGELWAGAESSLPVCRWQLGERGKEGMGAPASPEQVPQSTLSPRPLSGLQKLHCVETWLEVLSDSIQTSQRQYSCTSSC